MADYHISPLGNDLADGTAKKPFKTLSGAFNTIKVNKTNFSSDIKIYMADGNYYIGENELKIDSTYLPDGINVTIIPETNAFPIINGGKTVSGWKESTLNGNIVFSAQIEKDLDGVYSLIVNGTAADLAKSIDDAFDGRYLSPQNANLYPFAKGSFSWEYYDAKNKSSGISVTNNIDIIKNIISPSQTQAVWLIEWKEFLINIDKIEATHIMSSYWSNVIAKEIDVSSGAQYYWPCPTHRFYLQNDVSFITKAGEFCYDKQSGVIFYYPRTGEKITDIQAEIPLSNKMITMSGIKEKPIQNITFQRISFSNTSVDYIDNYGGFAINQGQEFEVSAPTGSASSPVYHRGMMGATISLEYCKNIQFRDCIFNNLGLTAVSFGEGTQSCSVEGCIFTNLGNCAVVISNPSNYIAKGTSQITDNSITNNIVRRVGQINKSSPAILVFYASGTTIKYNDIYDCPYTAISVGWGWSKLSESYAHKNIILQNRIGNYLTALKDGGGIYTLGNQPDSLIEYNYFYSQRNNIAGVYLDEGTSGYTVRYNAFYLNDLIDDKGYLIESNYYKKVPSMYWININDASGNAGTSESVMSDIKVISNFYFMKNGYGKTNAHIENVIPPIVNDNLDNPQLRNVGYDNKNDFLSSANVLKIMDYAGLQSKYQNLLTMVK